MKIVTFIVNMEKDSAKKEQIQCDLIKYTDLDIHFIKAIEGGKLSADEISRLVDLNNFKKRYANLATLPALGCSLSHISVYDIIEKSDINIALVLEDDASLSNNFTQYLTPIINWLNIQTQPIVILLSPDFSYNKYSHSPFSTHNHKVVKVHHGQMTSGYLINQSAAIILNKKLRPVRYLADDWDIMKIWGLNILGVVPNITNCPIELGEIGLSQSPANIIPENWISKLRNKLLFRMRYFKGIRYSRRSW